MLRFFSFFSGAASLCNSKGAEDLGRIREINSDLADAHLLKERLRTIYATAKDGFDAYCLLRGWCAATEATGVPELSAMAKTIRSHIKGIRLAERCLETGQVGVNLRTTRQPTSANDSRRFFSRITEKSPFI